MFMIFVSFLGQGRRSFFFSFTVCKRPKLIVAETAFDTSVKLISSLAIFTLSLYLFSAVSQQLSNAVYLFTEITHALRIYLQPYNLLFYDRLKHSANTSCNSTWNCLTIFTEICFQLKDFWRGIDLDESTLISKQINFSKIFKMHWQLMNWPISGQISRSFSSDYGKMCNKTEIFLKWIGIISNHVGFMTNNKILNNCTAEPSWSE